MTISLFFDFFQRKPKDIQRKSMVFKGKQKKTNENRYFSKENKGNPKKSISFQMKKRITPMKIIIF